MGKRLIILFMAFSLFDAGCIRKRNTKVTSIKKNIIVYRVFDSLEYSIASLLKSKTDSLYGVVISPVYKYCDSGLDTSYKFNIHLVMYSRRKRMGPGYPESSVLPVDSILAYTNRRILIDTKLYPVYIFQFDDIFNKDSLHANADKKYLHSQNTFLGGYGFVVDMKNNKILD